MNKSSNDRVNISSVLKQAAKILLGVTILLILLSKVGFKNTAIALQNFPLWAGSLFLLTIILSILLGGGRIWILNSKCWNQSLANFLLRYLHVQLIGLIIPAKLGDYLLVNKSMDSTGYGESTAVITADKILSVTYILFLGEIGLCILLPGVITSLLLFGTLTAFILVLTTLKADSLLQVSSRLLPLKIRCLLGGFSKELFSIISVKNLSTLSLNFLLFMGRISLSAAGFTVLINSVGISLGFWTFFAVLAVDHMILFIPISFWALGLTESIFLILLSREGIPGDVILGASLYCRVLTLVFLSFVYFLIPYKKVLTSAE